MRAPSWKILGKAVNGRARVSMVTVFLGSRYGTSRSVIRLTKKRMRTGMFDVASQRENR